MNSLQILSILNLENVEELKEILSPKVYYSISYDYNNFSVNSAFLFEKEEQLINHLLDILGKPIPKCQLCFPDAREIVEETEIKNHIFNYKHYKFDETIYKIKRMEVLS
tara:strand:+ start:349 stop:675 length:327 start_codon:yes stop_codon:yes gene_type:complete